MQEVNRFAQIAERFKPNTVLWAFHTVSSLWCWQLADIRLFSKFSHCASFLLVTRFRHNRAGDLIYSSRKFCRKIFSCFWEIAVSVAMRFYCIEPHAGCGFVRMSSVHFPGRYYTGWPNMYIFMLSTPSSVFRLSSLFVCPFVHPVISRYLMNLSP